MKTIICAQFKQETNRYAPGVSGVAEYSAREYIWDATQIRNAFTGTKCELGGFFDVLGNDPDYDLIPVLALNASPGPVTTQAIWQQVNEALLTAIRNQPKVDGILLALHGAMVTEKMEDGEGELLQSLRSLVGFEIPITVSLDLHANITQKMMDNATALFPCDYYPHTDFYECGVRAAACLRDTLEGKIRPVMKWNKLDLIFPYVPTENPGFAPLLQTAQSWRNSGKLIDATICHGFFASDIYEQGAAVLTVADGDEELAQKLADDLAIKIWNARNDFERKFYTPQEAISQALSLQQWPVVLADVADNPGSGATTDSVVLLQALLEAGVEDAALAVICDPETVQQAQKAGIGATIPVTLGGKQAPEITGGPLECTALVEGFSDGRYRNQDVMNRGVRMSIGESAVLRIGGVQVIVCSAHSQPYDLEVYRCCGIAPETKKWLIVKSAAHFRASFGTIAKGIYDVETPALGPMQPCMLPLAHSRRPIYPLDTMEA